MLDSTEILQKKEKEDLEEYQKKLEMDEIFIKALIKAQGKGYDIFEGV